MLFADADIYSVDEAAATAEQQLPEVHEIERRRPIEQRRLFTAPPNDDALHAVPTVIYVTVFKLQQQFYILIYSWYSNEYTYTYRESFV